MGYMLIASCKKCGFEEKCALGSGPSNYKTYCAAPAIDILTGKFVVENCKNKEQLKEKVIFYSEQELFKGKMVTDPNEPDWMNDTFESGSAVVKKTENKCPKCNNFTMEFEGGGIFG
jgi:hypothetical protein